MTIAAVQENGDKSSATSSFALAFDNDVVVDTLVVVAGVKAMDNGSADAFVQGDCTASGTSTLGTLILDVSQVFDAGEANVHCGIWSAIVTGAGTCTITIAGMASAGSIGIGLGEYSGSSWDSNRFEDSSNGNNAGDVDAATGDATSAGAAVFVAGVIAVAGGAVIGTPNADFTTIYEDEVLGYLGAIRRITATSLTDDATWTLGSHLGFSATLAVYKEAPAGNPWYYYANQA